MSSKLKSFKIREIEVSPNLLLAPMSGITNTHFRQLLMRENPGAMGLMVTEFISIEALTRENPNSLRKMAFDSSERPISIQIFGYDINRMVDSALMVQDAGADVVDINCGCPAPKVVRKGGGCELMRQPEHLMKILEAVRKAVSIPLTLKIRAGWSDEQKNALDVAVAAEQCGIDMLAVHGRTRAEMYRGSCDWGLIQEIAERLSIPVVGSGDIVDAASASEALNSGVAGLMIGRAALSNPWVFSEIKAGVENDYFSSPPLVATADILIAYRDLLRRELADRGIIGRLKQFTSQVTRRVHGSASARRELCSAKTVDEYSEILFAWREQLLKMDCRLEDKEIKRVA